MRTEKCIKTRRSIREFTAEPISHAEVGQLVGLAAWAPSWENCQPVRYIAVEDSGVKDQIAAECFPGWPPNGTIVKDCPLLMAVTLIHGHSGFNRDGSYVTSMEDRWEVFDAGIATQTFCLAAYDLGLGSVIIGNFDSLRTAEIIGLPPGQILAALVALGHPNEEVSAPQRRTVAELLSYR
jgi:nitroreductase